MLHVWKQNLTDDEGQRRHIAWHGRASVRWVKGEEYHRAPTFGWEWGLLQYALRWPLIEFHFNGYSDSCFGGSVNLPWLLYLAWRIEGIRGWRGPGEWRTDKQEGHRWWLPEERKIGLSWHNGTLWISIWENPNESSNTDPWWWEITVEPAEILFGRDKYSTRDLLTERRVMVLPEGPYPASVRIFESTWKRPRWPWPRRMVRAEITPDKPIPVPGKGENSWDCDEDATYGMTCAAQTPTEAVAHYSASILRDRQRYGGNHWVPA